jgi:hypothetical protein
VNYQFLSFVHDKYVSFYEKREEYLLSVFHGYMISNYFLFNRQHEVGEFILLILFIFNFKANQFLYIKNQNEKVSIEYLKENIVLKIICFTDIQYFKILIQVKSYNNKTIFVYTIFFSMTIKLINRFLLNLMIMFHNMGKLLSNSRQYFDIFLLRTFLSLDKFIELLDYYVRGAFNAIKSNNLPTHK